MSKKTTSPHLKFAVLSTDIICFKIEQGQLLTLVGKVQQNPVYPDNWAAIGGLIRPEETAEEAVDRLLQDKAGLNGVYKEQLYTFSDIDRDPRGRVVSVAYLGIISPTTKILDMKTFETKWLPVSTIPKLAYDHNKMLSVALERLRSKMEYTNIAQYFLPEHFTLSELQKVYEIILGKEIDKRNFRKKILAAEILKDTKLTRKEGVMRPAALYCFVSKTIKIVNLV